MSEHTAPSATASYAKSNNSAAENVRCCWSIRTLLLVFPVLVISMILFTGILVWLLSYINSTVSIAELSDQLQKELASRIIAKATSLLDMPTISASVIVDNVNNNLIDINNYDQIISYMWNYIKTFPQLSFISLSTISNMYYSYERRADHSVRWYIRNATVGDNRYMYNCNNVTGIPYYDQGPAAIRAGYKPAKRDWFEGAVAAAGAPYWSDIYLFTSGDSGVTHGRALFNSSSSSSSIFGVVTGDFTLAELNVFLKNVKVSANGKIVIVEKSGLMVASSVGSISDGTGAIRLPATNNSDPTISAVATYLQTKYGSWNKIFSTADGNRVTQRTETIDVGETLLLLLSEFTYHPRMDWVVLMVVPRSDFYSRTTQSTIVTMSITGVAVIISLFLALVASICLGYAITSPLRTVSNQMTKIANIEFTDTEKNALSGLYEFIQMDDSLKKMKLGLAQFKKFVPKAFLKTLKVSQLTDVRLGTCVSRELTLLLIDFKGLNGMVRTIEVEELFKNLNRFLDISGPIIRKAQGFIAKYHGTSIIAAFTEPKKAFKAAQKILSETVSLKFKDDYVQVCISMLTCKIIAGTIGEDEQIDTTIISDNIGLLLFMNSIAKRFNLGIVTTREEIQRKGLEEAKYRFINKYRIADPVHTNSQNVELYEVVNDPKQENLDIFTKATDILFKLQGKLSEAAYIFDYMLQKTKSDKLARSHAKLCNALLAETTSVQHDLHIGDALKDKTILDAFANFCKLEHSSENIKLWNAIAHYQTLNSAQERRQEAERLYVEFIRNEAKQAVNITDKLREEISYALRDPNTLWESTFFAGVQLELQMLMIDTFKRFKASVKFEEAFNNSSCRPTLKHPTLHLDSGFLYFVTQDNLTVTDLSTDVPADNVEQESLVRE